MKLDEEQLSELGLQIPLWRLGTEGGGTLTREFIFHDFAQAFGFMSHIAVAAEKRDHHPEWTNVYNRVAVTLTTHDADGISIKDVAMAGLMDRVAAALATQVL